MCVCVSVCVCVHPSVSGGRSRKKRGIFWHKERKCTQKKGNYKLKTSNILSWKKRLYLNSKALCHAGSALKATGSTLACSAAKRLHFQLLKGIKHMTSAGSSTKTAPSIPGWTAQNSFPLYSWWDQGFFRLGRDPEEGHEEIETDP